MCFGDKSGQQDRNLPPRPHVPNRTGTPQPPAPPPAPPLPPSASRASAPRRISPHQAGASRSNSHNRITSFQPSEAQSPDIPILGEAAHAIARCLNPSNIHWAIVGGASCIILGSTRTTDDIDFVVSKPEYVREAKNLLLTDSRFTVDPRTRHTHFHYPGHAPLAVEVLCSPSTFRVPFDPNTAVLDVNGIRILSLPTLLNSKCGSVSQRSTEAKRETDDLDIRFILYLARSRGITFSPGEVNNVSPELKEYLEKREPGITQLFSDVGL